MLHIDATANIGAMARENGTDVLDNAYLACFAFNSSLIHISRVSEETILTAGICVV
ncbi:hypothetical protein BN2476_2100002 [Paraburkholderia piptadeniae]|uniref:Uncharacterized protein n=1 Tax=Paraburkholderia piptadeniae TaxID=1701573 RepID=A0A1N7SXJ1_9BURK|nr:hypothetical protein BN2476_2100002 [Paraburkholderia piptadeniae]